MKRKRHGFTLIELLISFLLFAVVVGASLSILFIYISTEKKVTAIAEELQKEERGILRLRNIFAHVYEPSKGDKSKNQYYFYTEEPTEKNERTALVLTFEQGAQREIRLAQDPLAKLYFDPQTHELILFLWPNPARYSPKDFHTVEEREVLFKNIADCTIEFWTPPPKGSLEPAKWVNVWPRTSELPHLVKITCQRTEGDALVLAFPVRHPSTLIEY
jgi:prepilin-type N-terminal cleavage/methylation domain-containing protein